MWYNVTPSGYALGYYIIPHLGLTMTILPYKPYDNYYVAKHYTTKIQGFEFHTITNMHVAPHKTHKMAHLCGWHLATTCELQAILSSVAHHVCTEHIWISWTVYYGAFFICAAWSYHMCKLKIPFVPYATHFGCVCKSKTLHDTYTVKFI